MESNHFNETVNVVWQSGPWLFGSLAGTLEALLLIATGVVATVAMRRYQATLASSRALRPEAAANLQRALLPSSRTDTALARPAATHVAKARAAKYQPTPLRRSRSAPESVSKATPTPAVA